MVRAATTADGLAIVTGYGPLSEEVLDLAASLAIAYTRFAITPFAPWLTDTVRMVSEILDSSKRVPPLNPFSFSNMESEFSSRQIRSAFVTGTFPISRFFQASFPYRFSADESCLRYLGLTSPNFSNSIRYFLALQNFLTDRNIRPLLAAEIFPSLNIEQGLASERPVPSNLLERLRKDVVNLGRRLDETSNDTTRLAQAAIVDSGIVLEIEKDKGTDELIARFRRSRRKRNLPYLLKPPSVQFHPALDQPTIGPKTVNQCARAGLEGIIVCAETTTVINKKATIEEINRNDMFLYGISLNEILAIYRENFEKTWAKSVPIDVEHLSR